MLLLLFCTGFAGAQGTGGKLIYCQNRTLYAVPITATGEWQQGRTPHKITRLPNGTTLDSISVSADGNVIAFGTRSKQKDTYSFSEENETYALWTVAEKAGAQLLRRGQGATPRFAPSGRLLAYTSRSPLGENEYSTIYLLDLTTDKRRRLRFKAFGPCWSASGNEIALIDDSPRDFDAIVMVVDVATGKQVRFQTEVINAHSPLLSPNGRFLAYNPHLSRPKVAGIIKDRKTGKSIELPYAGEPVLDWSADSSILLWTRYIISPQNEGASLWEEIWTTTADGKQSHKIGAGPSACFAPDGRHVLYLRTQADSDAERLGLYVSDSQGRKHRLLRHCDDVFVVWKPSQRLNAASGSQK